MKVKKLTVDQLNKLREYLFTKRLTVNSRDEWQKYANLSDEVSKELQSRAVLK